MKKFLKITLFLLAIGLIVGMVFFPEALGILADSGMSYAAIGFAPIFGSSIGIENMGGMQNRLLIVPVYDVTAAPNVPLAKDAVDNNELVTAKGAFEFKEGKDYIHIRATKDTVTYNAENQGEVDGKSFHITGEFFVPAMSKEAAALQRLVNNTDVYLILFNREGQQILVGQSGLPATVTPSFEGGTAPADRRGFRFAYEADSFAPVAYLETPLTDEELAVLAGDGAPE